MEGAGWIAVRLSRGRTLYVPVAFAADIPFDFEPEEEGGEPDMTSLSNLLEGLQ